MAWARLGVGERAVRELPLREEGEGGMATRFLDFVALRSGCHWGRCAAFGMTYRKGGMGPRMREDNGWGRTPAATEGDDMGGERAVREPRLRGEGEGVMATRFFTPLRCVQNDMWGALRCARKDIWVEEGGWVPAPRLHGGRISTRGQRVGEGARPNEGEGWVDSRRRGNDGGEGAHKGLPYGGRVAGEDGRDEGWVDDIGVERTVREPSLRGGQT